FNEPRAVAALDAAGGSARSSGDAVRRDRQYRSSVNIHPAPSTALTAGHGFVAGAGAGTAAGADGEDAGSGSGNGSGMAAPGFTSIARGGTEAICQRPFSMSNHGTSTPGSSASPGVCGSTA